MPPFYVGSSSIEKVNKGYHGSVNSIKFGRIWKKEIKENPHLFKTIIVSIHEKRKEAIDKENKLQKLLNVVRNPLYINQSTAQINGCHGMDVKGKLNPNYGNKWSEDQRKAASERARLTWESGERSLSVAMIGDKTGKKNPNYGNKWSEAQKDKMRGENNPMFGKGFKGSENKMFGKHGQLHPRAKVYVFKNLQTGESYTVYDRKIFCADLKVGFCACLEAYKKGKTKYNKNRVWIMTDILPRNPAITIDYTKNT